MTAWVAFIIEAAELGAWVTFVIMISDVVDGVPSGVVDPGVSGGGSSDGDVSIAGVTGDGVSSGVSFVPFPALVHITIMQIIAKIKFLFILVSEK